LSFQTFVFVGFGILVTEYNRDTVTKLQCSRMILALALRSFNQVIRYLSIPVHQLL